MDRCEEIRHTHWITHDFLRELVGLAISPAVPQSAAREHTRKRAALVSAPAATVELRRPAKLTRDHNQRLFEQPLRLQIRDQRGNSRVEITDETVLLFDTAIVHIPTGAVDEIQVVRYLDKTHPALHQPPCEQTALTKLPAVTRAQIRLFFVEAEAAGELGTAELQALLNHRIVIREPRVSRRGRSLAQSAQQRFAPRLPLWSDAVGAREPSRSLARIGQIEVTVARAKKPRAAGNIRISDQHVGRHPINQGPSFVRDRRAERRIGHRAINGTPRVHTIGRGGVLINHIVVHRAHGSHAIHQRRETMEVLADAHPRDRRRDAVVIGARDLLRRIATTLGIKRIDLPHPAAEPDRNHVLRATPNQRGNRNGGSARPGRKERGADGRSGEEFATIHSGEINSEHGITEGHR